MDDDYDPSGKFVKPSVDSKSAVMDEESHKEPTYGEVFKNKNFMKLLSGQFFSNFGDAIFRIAILLYVYEITLSITSMTLILAAQTVPWIIIGPIAGVFADRISRKALMIGADIVRGLAILALPFMSSIYGIAVLAFILGAASATFVAPRSAAIPEITGMRLYVKAISLSQLVFQTLAVIGPLFAAPLYIVFKASTFWIASGCFFVSALILVFIDIPSASRDKSELLTFKTVLTDFKEGIVFLLKNKVVRLLILMFTFLIIGTAFAGPLLLPYLYEIRFNAIAIQYFNTPVNTFRIFDSLFRSGLKDLADIEYGYIGAVIALGSIIGNLSFGALEKIIGRPKAIFLGSVAIACYYFVFLFQPGFIAILIIGFVMGVLNGMFSLAINALFAENVPNEVRGRAYSVVNAYIQVFSVICYSLSGITADTIGVVITMAGSGIFLLLTTALIAIFTKFYRFANVNPQNASYVSK
ncbi:MAG: MFS transporter [Candidatus Heimdallarchaeaceae archaeon]